MARKTKKIPVRDEFLIVTNGKRSEKNYFEVLRGKIKSIYKIKVKFINGDPEAVVDFAVKEKSESNRVWCVFDKDEFSSDSIYHAMATADKNAVNVAFSNAAFEVWLIDHFCRFEKEKSSAELNEILDELLKEAGYDKGYSKSDVELIKKVFIPRLGKALENADIAHQKRVADHRLSGAPMNSLPVCSWNSYTNVHKLIEALKADL